MKTATYLRVSTADQTHEPQRAELAEYIARKGWGEVTEFSDTISGAKWTRSGLDRLMVAVRAGEVERIVVVKLDRLGRSLAHLVQTVSELDRHGVALIATSQGIDTSGDNPAGRFQLNVLAAVAEFERSLIRERTRAGMAAARARGAKIGRPAQPLSAEKAAILAEWKAAPDGIRNLAARLKVSVGKAHALASEI